MGSNWRQDDSPRFRSDQNKPAHAEGLFAEGAGVALGAAKHLTEAERETLTVELMSHEAVDTLAIEGEALDSRTSDRG